MSSSSHDGRTDILIPTRALITDTTFTFIPLPNPIHDHFGMVFAHTGFDLSAENGAGNPVTEFNLPVAVTLSYSDTDFGAIPEDTLGLYYWDLTATVWTDAVTSCPGRVYTRDLPANKLSLPLCHLTEFGLFAPTLNTYVPFVYHRW